MTKLIIGLGNPGKEYEQTRHNVGFFILDQLAYDCGVKINRKKFKGLYGEHFGKEGEKVFLIKPQTFMNLSGECVQSWVSFLKIGGEDVLVIHDEIDLLLGCFKAQWAAGSAGHKGILSIIERLGHKNFNRLRVGVGHPGRREGVVNFVLSSFSAEEREKLAEVVEKGVEATKLFIKMGLDPVSQMVNRRPERDLPDLEDKV